MKNKLMIDVGDIEKIKSAKDAVAISMFDALLNKEHKDPRRREMREGQLEGLKVIADLLTRLLPLTKRCKTPSISKQISNQINFKKSEKKL